MEGFLRQFNLNIPYMTTTSPRLSVNTPLNNDTMTKTTDENMKVLITSSSSTLQNEIQSASPLSTTSTTSTSSLINSSASSPTSSLSSTSSSLSSSPSTPSILPRRLSHGETSCLEMAKLYNKNKLSLTCQEYFQRVENIIYQSPRNNEKISPTPKSLNKKMLEHIKRLDSNKPANVASPHQSVMR